ncbi:hypothetical protein LEP1GSC150_0922 [Leptospira interrogans serovar Copenhageni str. LT2050]|uniref:Uncharacterized protein n=1 Tax=Leptospira interrogans serovar Copenhageni str. LT2050 TaxID=1001598 RepID=M3GAT3_LEPIT|nr:hypothetical protein LEP1GSC150_0922 [Leptospira interrogans serovar Copenhageni str. LT2050]KPA32902.1 Uncharacterized protein AMR50_2354 [Leptospira interrogans]
MCSLHLTHVTFSKTSSLEIAHNVSDKKSTGRETLPVEPLSTFPPGRLPFRSAAEA